MSRSKLTLLSLVTAGALLVITTAPSSAASGWNSSLRNVERRVAGVVERAFDRIEATPAQRQRIRRHLRGAALQFWALRIEAARVLSQYPSDYTIKFIAFDREEQGLHGSSAYVDAHLLDDTKELRKKGGSPPRLMITFRVPIPENFSQAEIEGFLNRQGYTRIHKKSRRMLEVFELLEFHSILESYSTVEEALTAFLLSEG